jgi:hypothetical protein
LFSGGNVIITDNSGNAADFYTLPTQSGLVTISASVTGVANPAIFNEISQ